jgi:hypothetical protein
MSHDSANLATPDIKWLGVRPSDLDKYDVPKDCRLDLTEHDVIPPSRPVPGLFPQKLKLVATGSLKCQSPSIQHQQPWCIFVVSRLRHFSPRRSVSSTVSRQP